MKLVLISMLVVIAGATLFVSAGIASARYDNQSVAVTVADSYPDCVMVGEAETLGLSETHASRLVDDSGLAVETVVHARPSPPGGPKCRIVEKRCTRTCVTKIDQAGNYTKKCTPWTCRWKVKCD